MKEISIAIPKDVLRALLEGKQSNYPYIIQGDGEPLRVTIWAAQPPPSTKFSSRRRI